MQTGSQEHKAQYFQDLLKQMRENIYFGDFQIWTIQQSVEKLQEDKAEAEARLKGKNIRQPKNGKEIKSLNEGIQNFLFEQVKIEDQNKMLENRIIELNEYVGQLNDK